MTKKMMNLWPFPFHFLIAFLILSHSVTAFVVPSSSTSSHLNHTGECDALLQFSNSFTISRDASAYYCDNPANTSYPKTASWKKDTDCCLWDGVTCHASTTHVVAIDLSCSWLRGSFLSNSNLFSLPMIQQLNLGGNDFSGSGILPRFDIFIEMTHLNLSYSKLSGPIPLGLGNLAHLTHLDLRYNNFNGTVDFEMFGRLKNLQFLDLSWNQVNVVLQSEGNCSFPRLQVLALSFCNLRNLPDFSSCTDELKELDLSHNLISGRIPEFWSVGRIRNTLTHLDLSSNNFAGEIPSSICKVSSLKQLSLANNNLNGTIPRCLGNQSLGPFLINFFQNSTVDIISLANNSFGGPLPIPPPTIRYYLISENNFSGDIPSEICHATMLKVIDLSNNGLTGFIPNCFINLSASLSVLNLRANKLVGEIPNIFLPKTSLRVIRLSQNRLNGTLPQSLAHCKNLEVLDLSENDFSGGFPNWLETLPNLQVLVLRSNQFHGLMESSNQAIHPFPKLRIFDLSDNKFYGPLPYKYIANFQAMRNEERAPLQYMGEEYYHDSIVLVMKGMEIELVNILSVFKTIDLSSNSFDGEIPNVIGDLKVLIGLNISHNNLIGKIPSSMGNLNYLEWLDLSHNKLYGEIPRGLADLSFLSALDLSNNQLMGRIPQSMQFDTFRHSFDGNPGLCGHPFPKECQKENDAHQTHPFTGHEEESGKNIEWRAVLMGYGCGLSIGISACYIMLETMRPIWLARMIEKERARKTRRTKKNVALRNHGRRSTRGGAGQANNGR